MGTAVLNKWGNAVGFRIPQAYLQQLGLKAGDRLKIEISNNNLIFAKAGPTLADLLSQYDSANRHEEAFIEPVGREII